MNIIGIDNGFGYTKTVHHSFASGVVAFDNPPYTSKGVLHFEKKYYVCGSGRQGLTKEKTKDNNYFILTLAAIAMEIESRGLDRNASVIIAAGLPLTSFGREKEAFEKYLMAVPVVKFAFEGKDYKVHIAGVKLFPQGYTAIAYQNKILEKEPSMILVDIGSWTVDAMMINNSIPDASTCRSLEFGVIRCIEKTQEEVRRCLGLSITTQQVEQVLLGKECGIKKDVKSIIAEQGEIYSHQLFKALAESGFDTRAVPTLLMGGGALIVKPYIAKDQLINLISDIHANAKGFEIVAKQVLDDEG